MTRAFLYGSALLLPFGAIWLVVIGFALPRALSTLALYGGPFFAAAVTSFAAPRHPIPLGMSIAVPSTILTIALPSLLGAFGGPIDRLDSIGMAIFSLTSLFRSFILCGLGSMLGSWLAKFRATG